MKIVFLTTQSNIQSTVIGRVFPLANELQKLGHKVVVFLHSERGSRIESGMTTDVVRTCITGSNPFERTVEGKKRHSGFWLLWTMKLNALRAAWGLITERPDYIILVKPLPENTLAASLAKLFLWKTKVILDVDDFELFANNLSSLFERAAIHASERIATALASNIVVATPFLYDHAYQMVAGKKEIALIPTGLSGEFGSNDSSNHTMLYIGSLSASSGHRVDLLPEIFAEVSKQIPDARLFIAGSGDNEHELKKQFQALGLESAVDFTGRFAMTDIPLLLAKTGVLLDPIDASIVSRAKSSFRCALALIIGIPIVTSSIGIRTELIPLALHERFFAIPEQSGSYAEKIIGLMKHPISSGEKETMREQSKKYTWQYLAQTYNKLLL